MKVLFAVNNERVSDAIIKKYQSMYKEIISWKNVYYFNAIIKELQKDKSYDRIVIGEDLEANTDNNYERIDNVLFDKLDKISDEASNSKEGDIPIILIATDRRRQGAEILSKLLSIGVYNILLGKDRKIDEVCKLIYQPRTKKEAKDYYRVEAEGYKMVDPDSVSESEIRNIIRHYEKLGRNEEKYVESFDEIASQYTDIQLKAITKFLPLNVRAVLEERSPKYQQVMIGSVKGVISQSNNKNRITTKNIRSNNINSIDLIEKELKNAKLTKPVVIPSGVDMQNVKKVYTETKKEPEHSNIENDIMDILSGVSEDMNIEEKVAEMPPVAPVKKGRGRPPKKVETLEETQKEPAPVKRGRGRPPKKVEAQPIVKEEPINTNNKPENIEVSRIEQKPEPPVQNTKENDNILPGLDEEFLIPNIEDTFFNGDMDSRNMPKMESFPSDLDIEPKKVETPIIEEIKETEYIPNNVQNTQIEEVEPLNSRESLASLITGDKKIVAFVGTSKNGTSFLVNNLAANLSAKGINTAILDLTKNKNAYYIYTANEDSLRDRAFKCIDKLRSGVAEGIPINKNLTVYTTVPEENQSLKDYTNILETLAKNYSLILLDCDFETDKNYFANAQEIYLVQTYDILTIQPLTAFLNELKYQQILDPTKLKVVINKTLKLRKLTDQMILGGISCYNDPASTYLNTLFDKDKIRYTTIPFEDQTYARYLERLVDCEISLNGYSRGFLDALERLSNMVYPLIASNNKYQQNKNYNDYNRKNTNANINTNQTFNNNMNATLNKMRNNF